MVSKPRVPRYFVNAFFALILPTRLFQIKRWLYRQTGVSVGHGVKINSECKIFGNGAIIIGDDTWIGIGVDFVVPAPAQIAIGMRCDIGPRVRFLCGSHLIGDTQRRAGKGITDNIFIGSGVWIGAGATLLPGAFLEDGVLVAAGAVVLRGRYPANALLAGNPASVHKIYEQ
jgi:maltose O-acetyltransferase